MSVRLPSSSTSTIARRPARPPGFTLVELLIVASLMTFISGVIVATLTGGFRVWAQASEHGVQEQAGLIAFEGIRRDLASARHFALIPFEGAYDELSFPAVGRVSPDPDQPAELGRLGYYFDNRRQLLCRSFVPYRLMSRVRLRDRCEVVLQSATQGRFDYFGAEKDGDDPGWTSGWESPASPFTVKVSVGMATGKKPVVTRTTLVSLPSGPGQEKKEE